MKRLVRITLLVLASSFLLTAANAAQTPTPAEAAPSIKLVQSGAKKLYVDLDYVLGLTTEQEQKQLPRLKEFFFDPFLEGVDRERLVRIDTLTGGKTMRHLAYIPLKDLKTFRQQNLTPADIDSKRILKTLYRLEDNFGVLGFMQVQNDYANISSKRGDVPTNIADPRPAVEELAVKYDLALDIQNSQDEQAAIDVRKKQFVTHIRTELSEMVKQTKLETDTQFEFRKLFTDVQLDELDRVYVGAKRARLGLVIDEKAKDVSTMDILLDPLPGTELAASLDLLAKKPSEFANVPRTEKPILSARVNHPLDEMRQNNAVRLSQFFRKQSKKDFEKDEQATQEEKTNRVKAADLFFDLIDASFKTGVLDFFAEAHPNEGGKYTMVGGAIVVDGNAIIEPLKLFPKASRGQKTELNVDEAGDVKIHRFTAATKDDPLFNDFLGSDVLYIGSSEKSVWYAGGENALEELKAAITNCKEPNTGQASDPVVDSFIKLGPWMKLRQAMLAGDTQNKDILKLRQMAVDAFLPADDSLMLNLQKVENRVEGWMKGQPGILRLIGKMMADFAKENLD